MSLFSESPQKHNLDNNNNNKIENTFQNKIISLF